MEREENIAGYILFSVSEENSIIEPIAVKEEYKGKRVGKSLIQTMESFVMYKGINKIKLGTQVDNIYTAQF